MQTSPAPAIVAGGAYQPVVLHAGIAYVSGANGNATRLP